LLGKPQTIDNLYRGSFDIERDEILNIHHLISQRVEQQNDASLLQFTAKIVFDDDSSVLLNSIADFEHFSEVKPLVSRQIHLSWSFLIKFQDRSVPEKQDIELSIMCGGSGGYPYYVDDSIEEFRGSHHLIGYITLRIKHTARSWGADVESLLSGHIKTLLLPTTNFRAFIQKHSVKIGFVVASTFFIATLIAAFLTAADLWNEQDAIVKEMIDTAADVDTKIDFVIATISSGLWSRYFFSVIIFLIASFIAAVFLGTWSEETADLKRPAFLILTKKSKTEQQRILEKYEGKGTKFLIAVATSIICSLAANYIFNYMWFGIS
jgi:hypothetical protein